MEPFDVFIAYLSWGADGKSRPVLFYYIEDETAYCYPITSRYNKHSIIHLREYFEIVDWMAVGLSVASYVDTSTRVALPQSVVLQCKPIGRLTVADMLRFIAFLNA